VDFSPFEWQKRFDCSWKCAVDFILQCCFDDLVSNILGLKHWEQTWTDSREHSRVDVVRTDERHADSVVTVRPQFAEETLVEANASKLGGRVIGASISSQQSSHRAHSHDVAALIGNHVGKKSFRGL